MIRPGSYVCAALVILAAVLGLSATSNAQSSAGREQAPVLAPASVRTTTVILGGSVNPVALGGRVESQRRWPLSRSANPLFRDAHVSIGCTPELSPAYVRVGGWVEIAPLSIFSVRAGVEPAYYFGAFTSLISFRDYGEDFSSARLDLLKNGAQAGEAVRMYVKPTVQLKVGPVAAVVSAEFERWNVNVAGPLFYEPYRDTLVAASGGTVTYVSAVLLHQSRLRTGLLGVGGLYDLTFVRAASGNAIERVGPVFLYEPAGKVLGLPGLKIIANAGYYLRDPSKKGQMYYLLGVSVPLSAR